VHKYIPIKMYGIFTIQRTFTCENWFEILFTRYNIQWMGRKICSFKKKKNNLPHH